MLNAVRILREDAELDAESRNVFLEMAFRNAERLNTTLNQLLDLSKLVSGRLVCRFQEVSLRQLLHAQLERALREASRSTAADAPHSGVRTIAVTGAVDSLPVILGDAPRLGQVLSSIFENALRFSPPGARIRVRVEPSVISGDLPSQLARLKKDKHEFVLIEVTNPVDETAASPSRLGKGGYTEIFGQKEGVLDRAHEGVGGSLAIAAEVLGQHGGALAASGTDGVFTVSVVLPVLENQEQLMKVLESRIFALSTEVGAVSLILLKTEKDVVKDVSRAFKGALFRATDTVYSLPDSGEVAVLMDDCQKADAPKILKRLIGALGDRVKGELKGARVGIASCPDDGTDPEGLLSQARRKAVSISEI